MAFDLDLAASLALDPFDVFASSANDLGSQVEAADRFKIDGNLLLRPFALHRESAFTFEGRYFNRDGGALYPAVLVALNSVRIATAESTLIDEIGQR